MKAKAKSSNLKLGLPSLIFFCSLFFFIGLFVSTILFQDLGDAGLRSTARVLEESSVKKEHDPLEHGKTGEDFVESISFQAFNILLYEIGQKYDAHYDVFDPAEYGPQQSQRLGRLLPSCYKECIGLKVKLRQGDGLLFYSLLPNGTIDKTSLHGSCPVIEGQKWAATKWIKDLERD